MSSDQTKSIDELLADGMLKPPEHFTETVLNTIAQQSSKDYPGTNDRQLSTPTIPSRNVWASIAVSASALLGMLQLIGFIAGIWFPATAV